MGGVVVTEGDGVVDFPAPSPEEAEHEEGARVEVRVFGRAFDPAEIGKPEHGPHLACPETDAELAALAGAFDGTELDALREDALDDMSEARDAREERAVDGVDELWGCVLEVATAPDLEALHEAVVRCRRAVAAFEGTP